MKIRAALTTILLGSSLTCHTPVNKINRVAKETAEVLENDMKFKQIFADSLSVCFSDRDKIIEYNKLLKKYNKPTSNYIIINKKECNAYVYSPDGDMLLKEEVVVGKDAGDKRSGGYVHKELRQSRSTAPGEYIINREGSKKGSNNEKLYGQRLLFLKGDHTLKESAKFETLALHQVPNSNWGRNRVFLFNNNTRKDNRKSHGCINFLYDSFDRLRAKIKGINTKVYILPEENNNSLYLEKQANGDYKFFQKKYRYEFQENNK